MTTILEASDGRRCDESCHDARDPRCVCICGGRFHGRGEVRAQEMLREDLQTGALTPELEKAAQGFGHPTLFNGSTAGERANTEQWRRAVRILGSRKTVMRLATKHFPGDVEIPGDVTKQQLEELIAAGRPA